MTAPRPCPPAPGPLEDYTKRFDRLFHTLAQRRSFRAYLTGLLLPHDRNKTLTALAGAEPVVQAQAGAVQRLQFFLSEADWDAEAINAQRLALMAEQPLLASHARGVLVVDDSGDRKDGHATAHVARQYIGSRGKIDLRDRGRDDPVGRRTLLLAIARATLYAQVPVASGCEGSGFSHQAADRHGAHRASQASRHRVRGRGGGLLLWRQRWVGGGTAQPQHPLASWRVAAR
jgi:DDE superfamily endonuclease